MKKEILFLSEGLRKEFYDYILSKGYEIIQVKKNTRVYESIQSHPDIFIYSLGSKIVVAPSTVEQLPERILPYIIPGENKIRYKYPGNICYNIARVGRYCIHLTTHTDPKIKTLEKKQWIHVNQGYSKCNVAVINESAVITSDTGIHRTLKDYPIESLLIRPGFIKLEGLNYGFIGGATIALEDEIVFYGDIRKHPDYSLIKAFVEKFGLKPVFFEFPLEDIGSGIHLSMK